MKKRNVLIFILIIVVIILLTLFFVNKLQKKALSPRLASPTCGCYSNGIFYYQGQHLVGTNLQIPGQPSPKGNTVGKITGCDTSCTGQCIITSTLGITIETGTCGLGYP